MQYLNKSFNVSMPNVSQEKWDRIFSKDSEDKEVSFEKIDKDNSVVDIIPKNNPLINEFINNCRNYI